MAGGAVMGLGALCYYGLGLSSSTGVIDHARYDAINSNIVLSFLKPLYNCNFFRFNVCFFCTIKFSINVNAEI